MQVGNAQLHIDPAGPKRLPGLWVICVLLGLLGMFWVSMMFFATPLGVAVFGAVALLHLGAAVGLWLRVNVVRLVVMGLLAVCVAVSAIGWAVDPEDNVAAAIPLVFAFAIIAHLWLRRAYFRGEGGRQPRLRSWSAAVAAGVVLTFGVGWVLLMTVDDARKAFPQLELPGGQVPADENGFVVIQQMIDRFPITEDEELDLATGGGRADGPLEPQEQAALAAQVVARWEPCLRMLDEALARPHFVADRPAPSLETLDSDMDWGSYCRRLASLVLLSSEVALQRGDVPAAMQEADKAVELGMRLAGSRRSIVMYFVGVAVMDMSLQQVREVSASPAVSANILRGQMSALPSPDAIKHALLECVEGEFRLFVAMLRDLGSFRSVSRASEGGFPGWTLALQRGLPFFKVNMSVNLLGDQMLATFECLDDWQPARPGIARSQAIYHDLDSVIQEMGWLHFLRNPIGDLLTSMLFVASQPMLDTHFRLVAEVQLTGAALALRCYHLEHGRLPESLEELAPAYLDEVPVDPFTERLFVYEPKAHPPRILSVGPDQTRDAPDAEDGDDIAVELAFPAP